MAGLRRQKRRPRERTPLPARACGMVSAAGAQSRGLTVFNRPSSRVGICGGHRGGFQGAGHEVDGDTAMTHRKGGIAPR
jgi:hypothetical protein